MISSETGRARSNDITQKSVSGTVGSAQPARSSNDRGTSYQLGAQLDPDGEVYDGKNPLFSCPLVVKLFPRAAKHDLAAVKGFFKESGRVSLLRHPAIAQVLDMGLLRDRTPFVSMEKLSGLTLDRLLDDDQPFSVADIQSILGQLVAGLTAARATGVAHRELRPDNIFLLDVPPGAEPRVKLLDFGVSRLTWAGVSRGRRPPLVDHGPSATAYLAPEQIAGGISSDDSAADQFALAVLTYRLLTGNEPSTSGTIRSITPSIHGTSALDAVLMKALSPAPSDRFPSVTAFFKAFEAAMVDFQPAPFDGPTPVRAVTVGANRDSDAITKEMVVPLANISRARPARVPARLLDSSTSMRRPNELRVAGPALYSWEGAVTHSFFADGDRQEAEEWEGSPLATATRDPDLEFDSFDRVPRRRGPRLAAAFLVAGMVAGAGWWITERGYAPSWLTIPPQFRSAFTSSSTPTPTPPPPPAAEPAASAAPLPAPAPAPEPAKAVAPPVVPTPPIAAAHTIEISPAPAPAPALTEGSPPPARVVPRPATTRAAEPTEEVATGLEGKVEPVAPAEDDASASRRGNALRGYVWSPTEKRLVPSNQASAPAPAPEVIQPERTAPPPNERVVDPDAPLPPAP